MAGGGVMVASVFAGDGAITGAVCAEHGQKHITRNFLIEFFFSLLPSLNLDIHTQAR